MRRDVPEPGTLGEVPDLTPEEDLREDTPDLGHVEVPGEATDNATEEVLDPTLVEVPDLGHDRVPDQTPEWNPDTSTREILAQTLEEVPDSAPERVEIPDLKRKGVPDTESGREEVPDFERVPNQP